MTQPNLFGAAQTIKTSDDCYTPKWLFDVMGITFDLDVACPPEGPINVPAANHYTAADDGLAQPWHGRVWMNPPYSNPSPWVNKWLEHRNGVALLPVHGGKWCKTLWESDAKGVWLGRLAFVRNGKEKPGSPMNIVIWAIGEECVNAIEKLGKPR